MKYIALAFALAWCAPSSRAGEPALTIVSFSDALSLESGGQIVVLGEGSSAYAITPDRETSILSGEAVMQSGSASITAGPGARFSYLTTKDLPRLIVHAGSLRVAMGGVGRSFGPGETFTLIAPLAPAEPIVESPPMAPSTPPMVSEPPPAAVSPETTPVPEQAAPAPTSPPPAVAKGGWKLNMELRPFYNLKESYDSNIYRVPRDKPGVTVGGGVVGSWITNNTLGAKLLIPLSRSHKAEAQYKLSATNYSRQSRANDAYDNSADFQYVFTGKRLKAKGNNAFTNTEIPAFSELVVRERRWQNTTGFSLEVEQGRLLVYSVDGQHSVHKYVSRTLGGLLNHYEQQFGGSLGYRLMPKTKLYASYHRTIIHYSAGRSANSKGHSGDLGIEGQLSSKVKGKIQAGFHQRRYDALAGVPNTARGWQSGVDLNYNATRRINVTLNGSRSFTESTTNRNRYYIGSSVRGTIKFDQKRYALGINGSYQTDRYPESDTTGGRTALRRDDLYTGGFTADYKFREWLKASASYSHLARFSIFSGQFNYRAHVTGLDMSLSFK